MKPKKWRCKSCGAVLRVTPDPNPKLLYSTLRCKEGPVCDWDYANELWWHRHQAEDDKGWRPTEFVKENM